MALAHAVESFRSIHDLAQTVLIQRHSFAVFRSTPVLPVSPLLRLSQYSLIFRQLCFIKGLSRVHQWHTAFVDQRC